ncbi:hypothetical protein Ancab_010515 [Ancistrocladus abbreviatus]
MVEVRMHTGEVAAEVKCSRKLIGMRCSNIYDLSRKTYIFKLMNSSGVTESGESEKLLLLLETGVREKSNTPSGFTLKLRKHIRTRRLEDIIIFQFGLGTNAHYIILELSAQGNIILTYSEFTVLTLLQSHSYSDFGVPTLHLTPHSSRSTAATSLTISQSSLTPATKPLTLSPQSSRRRSHFQSSRSVSQPVISHAGDEASQSSVLSPHSQPVISHAGDEAPQSSQALSPHSDLTLSPQPLSPRRPQLQSSQISLSGVQISLSLPQLQAVASVLQSSFRAVKVMEFFYVSVFKNKSN